VRSTGSMLALLPGICRADGWPSDAHGERAVKCPSVKIVDEFRFR
jgi:hypothetical protein